MTSQSQSGQSLLTRSRDVTIINIDARVNNNDNPVINYLKPGTYDVQFIGQSQGGMYDAWSRWNFVYECDENGENCTTGWLNEYYIKSSEFIISVPTTGVYATSELALSKAKSTSFTLKFGSDISFYISDDLLADNQGGVSLAVKQKHIRQPPSLLGNLVLFGLLIASVALTLFILDP
ncbi:MAG: hypothetical protein RIM23_19080 [Coleofasciculus sp. G3-WIS-01]|uniref:hypothetical protein n=1 Tax=Coleofasciculus sp. G3-WIS-01 TaxID=3069528 RepID=UPI0032F3A654